MRFGQRRKNYEGSGAGAAGGEDAPENFRGEGRKYSTDAKEEKEKKKIGASRVAIVVEGGDFRKEKNRYGKNGE